MTRATIEQETATQFVSMFLSTYDLPFQILSPTPYPGKIGVRLHPDEPYCLVDAVRFSCWIKDSRPSLDKLQDALNKKRKLNRHHV